LSIDAKYHAAATTIAYLSFSGTACCCTRAFIYGKPFRQPQRDKALEIFYAAEKSIVNVVYGKMMQRYAFLRKSMARPMLQML
jgi:hypothetical protein